MKYKELHLIAKRQGFVRWNRSGVQEQVSLQSGLVVAKCLTEQDTHHIRTNLNNYYCVEVDSDRWVCLGDLVK